MFKERLTQQAIAIGFRAFLFDPFVASLYALAWRDDGMRWIHSCAHLIQVDIHCIHGCLGTSRGTNGYPLGIQRSYGKYGPLVDDLPIKNGQFFHMFLLIWGAVKSSMSLSQASTIRLTCDWSFLVPCKMSFTFLLHWQGKLPKTICSWTLEQDF